MFGLTGATKYKYIPNYKDMRGGYDKLCGVVRTLTGRMEEGTAYIFTSKDQKLVKIMHTLVDQGNTVVVIEHNLDVIKTGDYIIDMGPEGGSKGGTVVVAGTPEEVAKCKKSYTGAYIKRLLK